MGDYEYEVRRKDAVLATGHIQLDEPPNPGEELSLGHTKVVVVEVLRLRGTPRLILEQT